MMQAIQENSHQVPNEDRMGHHLDRGGQQRRRTNRKIEYRRYIYTCCMLYKMCKIFDIL